MASVFLSYTSTDRSKAVAVRDALEQRNISVWLDADEIRVGEDIRRRIEEGLAKSDFFVILLSRAALESPWVQTELSGAFARKASAERSGLFRSHIIPALIEDCPIPPTLAGIRTARLDKDFNQGIEDIVRVAGSFRVRTFDLGRFTAKMYRSGDYSTPNKIAFSALNIGGSLLACVIEGTGEDATSVGQALLQIKELLPSILEMTQEPSLVFEFILKYINLLTEAQRSPNSGHIGAKLTAALITDQRVLAANVGEAGGALILGDLSGHRDMMICRFDSPFLGAMRAEKGVSFSTLHSFPLGNLASDWSVRPFESPVAGNMRVVLTSRPLPRDDLGGLAGALSQGGDDSLLAKSADLAGVRPGEDFVAVLVFLAEAGDDADVSVRADQVAALSWETALVNAEGLFIVGEGLLSSDRQRAIANFRQANHLVPTELRYALTLALALVEDGSPEEAKVALRQILPHIEEDAGALASVGQMADQQGWWELAAHSYDCARRLLPDDADLHYFYGHAVRNMQDCDLSEAARAFQRSVELNPNDGYSQQWLGSTLVLLGRPAEAVGPLLAAVAIAPTPANHHWLGVAFAQTSAWREAGESLRASLQNEPDRMDTTYWLAVVSANLGHFEEANGLMSSVVERGPEYLRESALKLLSIWRSRNPPAMF